MQRYNNWMWYTYDDLPPNQPKPKPDSVLNLHFDKSYKLLDIDYFEALRRNALLLQEIYGGPFDVMLSGGIDSEVIVRMNHMLGIKQNVYTFRFENDINFYDVYSALTICNDLGIKLNLIDFNVQKFFENEAEHYYKISYPSVVEKLVRFKFYEYMDHIPVAGDGEPYWVRDEWDNFNVKSTWSMLFWEFDYAHATYSRAVNRTVIGEWYQFTPEIWTSFIKLPKVVSLLNDDISGRLSSWSYRTELHQTLWPTIRRKPKLVGYEGLHSKPWRPEYMTEFQKTFMPKDAAFRFTVQDMQNLFNKDYEVKIKDQEYFKKFYDIHDKYQQTIR